ncbi:MAG: precorrin-3B C(17)-methyltransferase [Desulfobacteraceae bacterium]|nr:precorrin-3B C(17)-methyltransferase [Desulfobacteraceae bacterium]
MQSSSIGDQTENSKCRNSLYIVGLGPGSTEHLSGRARAVLESSDSIVGYNTYTDMIRPLFPGKNYYQSSMKKEIERASAAIDFALQGRPASLVSSGDPGIYAMAGLVFELCKAKNICIKNPGRENTATADHNKSEIILEIVPGIPALSSCASVLGAPLTHDFAVISLSDLLTPWDVIERRIESAAMADFVIVFYNPRSKKRNWQLQKAREIILKYRAGGTPVGIATSVMRDEQQIHATTLENMNVELVNMQSTVFVGNKTTFLYHDYMVTPRGYSDKYELM